MVFASISRIGEPEGDVMAELEGELRYIAKELIKRIESKRPAKNPNIHLTIAGPGFGKIGIKDKELSDTIHWILRKSVPKLFTDGTPEVLYTFKYHKFHVTHKAINETVAHVLSLYMATTKPTEGTR